MVHKKFIFGLVTLAVILGGGLLFSRGANALSDTYFDSVAPNCDVNPCSADEQTAVAEGSNAPKSQVNLSAYFNSPNGTLVVHNANFCPSESGNKDTIAAGNYIDRHPGALKTGDHIVKITVTPLGGTPIVKYGVYYAAPVAACDADIPFTLTGMTLDSGSKKFAATIVADPVDNFPGTCTGEGDGKASLPGNAFCDGYTNYFNFQETSSSKYVIAQNNDNSQTGYKVTMRSATEAVDYGTLSIKFGSDCSVTSSRKVYLTYYDMDNSGTGNAQPDKNRLIHMYLLDSSGKKVDTDDGTEWVPSSASNVTEKDGFIAQPNEKYTWVLENVYRGNLIQLGTPFDGIYALVDCTTTPPPKPTQPYFQSTGGDVVAGTTFASATATGAVAKACADPQTVNSDAGIVSWNTQNSVFAGAGSEYASYALGFIEGYATGQNTGQTGNGKVPVGLTFSNKNIGGSVNPTADPGRFGGLFGSTPCVDYWENKPATADMTAISTPSVKASSLNGTYWDKNDLTITGNGANGQIGTGTHATVYVNGDVMITGDINFQPGSPSGRTQIPSFRLIVHGTIFIGANVTNLDGVYVAIPDSDANTKNNDYAHPNAGTITDCATSNFGSYDPPQDGITSPINTACGSRLTINGAVAAQQLWLLRSNGTGEGMPSTPAETINYTPETWLSIDPSSIITPDLTYQSIIGLPPVL